MQNQDKRHRPRPRRHFFTLIEIMIVIVIMGLMAGLVGPRVISRLQEAKKKTAQTQIKLLGNAVKDYYMDMDEYPKRLDDLIQSPGGDKWDGPYLDPAKIPKTPWGGEYQYSTGGKAKGQEFEISCEGPDGTKYSSRD